MKNKINLRSKGHEDLRHENWWKEKNENALFGRLGSDSTQTSGRPASHRPFVLCGKYFYGYFDFYYFPMHKNNLRKKLKSKRTNIWFCCSFCNYFILFLFFFEQVIFGCLAAIKLFISFTTSRWNAELHESTNLVLSCFYLFWFLERCLVQSFNMLKFWLFSGALSWKISSHPM